MRFGYQFTNLCGSVYKGGNVIFTPDGNSLLSPVGNRITLFDLVNHTSVTLPVEHRGNVEVMALSPDGSTLLAGDSQGLIVLISLPRRAVLGHLNARCALRCAKFSPDGRMFAFGAHRIVEVWRAPSVRRREFTPFEVVRRLPGHHDDVVSVDWSADSRWVLSASLDGTAQVHLVDPERPTTYNDPITLAGHVEPPVGAFFLGADASAVLTVTRGGRAVVWRWLRREGSDDGDARDMRRAAGAWTIERKEVLTSPGGGSSAYGPRVVTCALHRATGTLAVGFKKGVFALYSAPSLSQMQALSVSRHKLTAVDINASGEWIAFASAKLGQLLVWEWQSETYVLKQQGHYCDVNSLAYAPSGQLIATGGDDSKVKIWNTQSWHCFVTFAEHNAPVSAVAFAPNGLAVFSSSYDGTVRAFDLIRYRNFRIFTPPTPAQLSCLAIDAAGEIVAAGSLDTFEIFVWSVQTGKLLDVLSGHQGPVAGLAFAPGATPVLASVSWDKTARLWDVFEGHEHREALELGSDGLALAFRPDGKELCTTSINGNITFWDHENGVQLGTIEGRDDISGGRWASDVRTSKTNPRGKSFTSVAYSADGQCVIASGESKYVCIYEISQRILLKKFQTSKNRALDGVLDFLNSSNMTEAGPKSLLDIDDDDADVEILPGATRGDKSKRSLRPAIRTKAVKFSPDGRSWAAATTEGLLIYSLDEAMAFDPFELDESVTPESVRATSANGDHLRALVMALRLNEVDITRATLEAVPSDEIALVAQNFPLPYIRRLVEYLAKGVGETKNLELYLVWGVHLFQAHGEHIKSSCSQLMSALRSLHKNVTRQYTDLSSLCSENRYTIEYVASVMPDPETAAAEVEDEEEDEAETADDS
eukprot:m51a1_g4093 hypothetical protein (875) ;mRNA; r:68447-71634